MIESKGLKGVKPRADDNPLPDITDLANQGNLKVFLLSGSGV